MTDNERLERIKSYCSVTVNEGFYRKTERVEDIEIGDFEWLIEQAEKVQSKNEELYHLGHERNDLLEKVERYERALKLIIKNTMSGHVENVAKKALTGKF